MPNKANTIEDEKTVQKVDKVEGSRGESIDHLINLIRMRRTTQLREQKLEELNKLTNGQTEVNFSNNLRRILTLAAKDDGSFEMTEELEKLINKALSGEEDGLLDLLHGIGMRFDIDSDQTNLDNLLNDLESSENTESKKLVDDLKLIKGTKPTKDQMKKLTDLINDEDNIDLRHLSKKNKLIQSKQKFSKAEKENMIESIRLFVDQKHSLNDMSIQTLIRLESEMDQTYQYLMSIVKSFSDTLRTIARNVKGG